MWGCGRGRFWGEALLYETTCYEMVSLVYALNDGMEVLIADIHGGVGASSMEEAREPSRNGAQIGFIALSKLVAQRGFFDEDHKHMNYCPYQQSISDKKVRAKEDGFPDHYRKNSKIHRIANPLIGSLGDQVFRRIDGRWRSFSNEGELSRTPEIEPHSQQEREETDQPDGRKHEHKSRQLLKQEPGNDESHCSRDQD